MVKHGIVFLRGNVVNWNHANGGVVGWNDKLFDLPAEIQPGNFFTVDASGNGQSPSARLHFDSRHSTSYAGFVTLQAWNSNWGATGNPTEIFLEGISWAL